MSFECRYSLGDSILIRGRVIGIQGHAPLVGEDRVVYTLDLDNGTTTIVKMRATENDSSTVGDLKLDILRAKDAEIERLNGVIARGEEHSHEQASQIRSLRNEVAQLSASMEAARGESTDAVTSSDNTDAPRYWFGDFMHGQWMRDKQGSLTGELSLTSIPGTERRLVHPIRFGLGDRMHCSFKFGLGDRVKKGGGAEIFNIKSAEICKAPDGEYIRVYRLWNEVADYGQFPEHYLRLAEES